MTPFARDITRLPETFVFHRLVTSGEIAVYDQIVEACAVRTDGSFAWPIDEVAVFAERARRQFFVTPSPKALLRMRGAPTRFESGALHADLVRRLQSFMKAAEPAVFAGYGGGDPPFLRECAYRSLAPAPIAHPQSVRIDIELMTAASALLEEEISYPGGDGDDIASLAAVCSANGFDVEDGDLLEARPFVAATMALAGRLWERAPEAFAAILACADPAHVHAITDDAPFLHVSIRGGRAQVRPLLPIAPAAPGENLRCIDVTACLDQSDDQIRAGKAPGHLKIVILRADRYEIAFPLTGSAHADRLRRHVRRAPGVNRAFPPPSVDELQTCAQKLRNSGRLLSVLNDLFRQLERVPSDPAAPVDEQENAGPSQFAVDAYLHRLSPTVAISDLGALVAQMRDPRLRELGRRMVWDAVGSDKIPRDQLGDYVRFLRRRLLGRADARWRTIAAARHELAELTQRLPTLDADHAATIARYLDYLEQTAST